MKKTVFLTIILILLLTGCVSKTQRAKIAATTRPVYEFTSYLCQNTGLDVELVVTENVSCLHDYTLQVRQMRCVESADMIVISGAGLETFLTDVLENTHKVIDASENIPLHCSEHADEHTDHHHEEDPHIWLSVSNARIMSENICKALSAQYPEHAAFFSENLKGLTLAFDELEAYGKSALADLSSRNLITFHDGFAYFADYWGLNILHSLEEESGSEASAAELKEMIQLVRENNIPAIFTEENGSASAAQIIAAETGIAVYQLSMGMSETGYFESMYHNIDVIKEALG